MEYPLVSVIVATYNSESTLRRVLESIQKQKYPQNKIEVLVVDGGSKDKTVEIAKKFKCKICKNPKVSQVFGKQIGVLKAKGKYIVFLDSDEVLIDRQSFSKKVDTFFLDKRIKAVLPSGYVTPKEISGANYFVNEFGDPFSYFMYNISINPKYFLSDIEKIARNSYEDTDREVFDFSKTVILPPLELSAIGVFIEKRWLLKTITKIREDPALVSQSFYYLPQSGSLLGITKNDPVLHYSVSSWTKYLKKIRSRIINNVYKTKMGMSAFSGREKYYPPLFQIKKYMFIPYSLSIIFPLIRGIHLSFSRRELVFLVYPFLCLYTSILIIFYYLLKLSGRKIRFYAWGN